MFDIIDKPIQIVDNMIQKILHEIRRKFQMKTIKELANQNGRVYVRFSNEQLCADFLRQAEAEGFTFIDGASPTQKTPTDMLAVNRNLTLNYVGANGRIAYGSGAAKINGEPMIRIEWEDYISI